MNAGTGALTRGSSVGSYTIERELGRGGMGVVYLATDTRLDRQVAIKALPETLAADPDRLARFQREAKVLASLNHPHIGGIHGLEEHSGLHYLILEYIEGETLADRLKRGPIPLDEALELSRQIAEALEAAHDKGIVHRDIKPGNVMVTHEGSVKVLDFGLARTADGAPSSTGHSPVITQTPTLTTPGPIHSPTIPGAIMGSAGYMSPEQARGKPVDKRSDIFSFGCVLYEMLTGAQPFSGENAADSIGATLHKDTNLVLLPSGTPRRVRDLLSNCLAKDRRQRLHDIGDARLELERAITEPRETNSASAEARPWLSVPKITITALLLAGVAALTFGLTRWLTPPNTSTSPRSTHATMVVPEPYELGSLAGRPIAISRDGSRVAYVGSKDGNNRILVQPLDKPEPQAIEGSDGGEAPFFSPDGQWIGFFAGSKLRKVAVGGGAMQALADAPFNRGGCWGDDGFIYFAPTNVTGIWRVPESGGEPSQVTHLNAESGEISHRWPHRVAGTNTLLFAAWTGPGDDEHHIAMSTVGEQDHRLLINGDSPQFAATPGLLLFTQRGQLFTVPWKPTQRDLGRSVPIAAPEQVNDRVRNEGSGNYAASDDGTLVYIRGKSSFTDRRVVWVDRQSTITPVPLPARMYMSSILSPDGGRAVLQIMEGIVRISIYDFDRGTLTPLNTGAGSSQAPLWSADGKRVYFRGTRKGTRNLYWIQADGSGEEQRLTTKSGVIQTPTSVSTDGKVLLFDETGPDEPEGAGIWVLPLDGDPTPRRLFARPAAGQGGQLSPDGKWIAYVARVSSRPEIFVSPYPGPGERRLVSTEGGAEPLWSADGRELFFQSGGRSMAVTVEPGPTFSASPPRPVHERQFVQTTTGGTSFSVTRDGARFLRIEALEQNTTMTRIELVLNWFLELRQQH